MNHLKFIGKIIFPYLILIATIVVGIPWVICRVLLEQMVDLLNGLAFIFQGLINLMDKGKHQIYLKVIRPVIYSDRADG